MKHRTLESIKTICYRVVNALRNTGLIQYRRRLSCTEQTVSGFLPNLAVTKTLQELKLERLPSCHIPP